MKKYNKNIIKTLIILLVILFNAICIPPTLGIAASSSKNKLSNNTINIEKGNFIKLELIGRKDNIKWSSSNKKIATVNSKGKVTAKKVGKAKIIAERDNKKYTCCVKVNKYRIKLSEKESAEYIMNLNNEFLDYSHNIMLADYITKLHYYDFLEGKSFADFDDYEEYFGDFYRWSNEIINFKGELNKKYRSLLKEIQNVVAHHIKALNKSYNKNNKEALAIMKEDAIYAEDKLRLIADLLRKL